MNESMPLVCPDATGILLLKWGALGSLVASTAALRAVRAAYPTARITLLTNTLMGQIAPPGTLADEHLDIAEFENAGAVGQFRLLRALRGLGVDIAISLRWSSERCALLSWLSGAGIRCGSGPDSSIRLFTHRAERPDRRHEILRSLDIVRSLGVPVEDETPSTHITDEDRRFAADFLAGRGLDGRTVLCLHPGAAGEQRAWMPDRFAEAGWRLASGEGATVLVTWAPGERDLAERICSVGGGQFILAPETGHIGRLAALIASCRMFFTNCTGPMNVAVAVRTPVVALLGSSDPADLGPYGPAHRWVKSPVVPEGPSSDAERLAMEAIDVESVWEVLRTRWRELSDGVVLP
jgi:ADP-heptose:LPS heptosyltransferase